ncbi:hypothetical protein N7466_008550 [Penicillium verhagenii]|uniref:uncharacterized protein n=1 Tax=Penicillium verhagenii TaxID=1562060 RepID=UPI002544FA26|nr:uncharacterized protein N7466_008550 [Penicillium verhagenii]KAJ5924363.1 hypothetical protein N7466_008550 [Penicillium verhagenii]
MARVYIADDDLTGIKDKVILITGTNHLTTLSSSYKDYPQHLKAPILTLQPTGASSGIGRATAQLCLDLGAKVVIGDLNPPNPDFTNTTNITFQHTDVTQWESLRALFTHAMTQHGHIDHVFANAGINPTPSFLEVKLNEAGEVQPPNMRTINVNFLAVINTIHLANAYMTKLAPANEKENGGTGSIVLAASTSSFQTFSTGDYTIAKHGVLGMLRAFVEPFQLQGKVRINAVAPSWTDTGIMPAALFQSVGVGVQSPEVVARSVVLLFADEKRHGDVLYSWDGNYREINNSPGGLLEGAERLLDNAANEQNAILRIREAFLKAKGA